MVVGTPIFEADAGPSYKLEEGKGGTVWIDPFIKLPVTIEYDFIIHKAPHELIGVFSQQCGEWGSGSDGLTWHVADHRNDLCFRTKIFGHFPSVERHEPAGLMEVGKMYRARVQIDAY